MRLSTALAIGLALLTLSSCGGNDSGGGLAAGAVPVRFAVKWPLRSLAFNAPASAQSAVLRLPRGREDAQDAVVLINRNGGPAAYDDSIVSVDRARIGTYECRVDFYSSKDAGGFVVANAGLRVNVDANGNLLRADGTPLGTVSAVGKITSVIWNGNPAAGFLVNEPVPAPVLCVTSENNVLAVSPGSIFVDVVSGAGAFSFRPEGTLVSSTLGSAKIRFRVDGVSSDPIDTTTLGVKRITASGDVIAVQPNGKILVGSRAGKTVKEYDPTSGSLLRTFNLGVEPSVIAVSKDGSRAYIGLYRDNGYKRVDLTTGQVSARVNLSTSAFFNETGYPVDIDVDPNNPSRIVVAFQVDGSSTNGGAAICVDDVQLPMTLQAYEGTSVCFVDSGTVITQAIRYSATKTRRCVADENGLTEVRSSDLIPVGEMVTLGGRVVSSRGSFGAVFSPSTLQVTASFSGGSSVCADPATGTVYTASGGSGYVSIRAIRPSTGQIKLDKTFPGISNYEPSGSIYQTQPSLAVGAGTIAFRSSPNEVVVVSGLP